MGPARLMGVDGARGKPECGVGKGEGGAAARAATPTTEGSGGSPRACRKRRGRKEAGRCRRDGRTCAGGVQVRGASGLEVAKP